MYIQAHIVQIGFVNVTDPNVTRSSPSATYVHTLVALHSEGHDIIIRNKWYRLIALCTLGETFADIHNILTMPLILYLIDKFFAV
jgi:hypothetical protein